jgi:hypothetical protein
MGAEIYGNIGFKQHRVQGNMGGIEQQNGEQWELVIIVGGYILYLYLVNDG